MTEYYLDQTYYIIYYSINIKYMWTEPKSGSPRDLMDKVLLCDKRAITFSFELLNPLRNSLNSNTIAFQRKWVWH